MDKIKVLLWDIDGTILNFKIAEMTAIRTGFGRMKLGECTDAMLRDYSQINDRYWKMLERGEMTKPQILVGRFREFFTKYGIDPKKAEEFNQYYQTDLGDTVCFNDDAYRLIAELRQQGFKQYGVTNGTLIAQEKKLQLSGLDMLLDGCFISEKLGFEKPRKEFFDCVFASIGRYAADEVLIIGDSLTSDITGGCNAGILTCWYNPEGKTNDTALEIDYEIRDLNELKNILK